ncbi:phosphatidic acid phosphatase type 2/haloperoxidase [Blastocladiella britannica]|nr:phosphatidic acid phosphatase type 2/haloperoxidase [Blastocladiella britannica]
MSSPNIKPAAERTVFAQLFGAPAHLPHPRETMVTAEYRSHLFLELITLVVVIAVGGVLNILTPNEQSFLVNDVNIQYPMRAQTIPEAQAGIISVGIPLLLILLLKRTRGVRPAVGLLMAAGITLFVTGALKNLVGALRPDFLDRCQPKQLTVGAAYVCTGNVADIKEGRRSFPSGHSSVGAAGTLYLSIWFAMQLRVFDPSHVGAKGFRLFLAHLPVCGGAAIALTRILDNRHHWLDVFTGFALGSYIAVLTARVYIKGFGATAVDFKGLDLSPRDLTAALIPMQRQQMHLQQEQEQQQEQLQQQQQQLEQVTVGAVAAAAAASPPMQMSPMEAQSQATFMGGSTGALLPGEADSVPLQEVIAR